MNGKIRVTIDHARCVGTATCVAVAPGVFALDQARLSIVTDPDGEPVERVLEAADLCPMQAIAVSDREDSPQAGKP